MKDIFNANYSAEIVSDVPAAQELKTFANEPYPKSVHGVTVKVMPNAGNTWFGRFQTGLWHDNKLCTTPNPNKLCVISGGAGYIVSADNPSVWHYVNTVPILAVFQVQHKNLLLFNNFTGILATNENGILWHSDFASDDVTMRVVLSESIIVTATDCGRPFQFELSLVDGSIVAQQPIAQELLR